MASMINRREFLTKFLVGIGAATALRSPLAVAQTPGATIASSPEKNSIEAKALTNCLNLIRENQLANGAINMRKERDPNNPDDRKQAIENGENPDERKVDTVRVIPYFANLSALALLSSYSRRTRNPEDLQRAAKWLAFYAANQLPDSGYISDYTGSFSRGGFRSKGEVDSVDSYASTFLQAADFYYQVVKLEPLPEQKKLEDIVSSGQLLLAAKRSLHAIQTVMDADGLTWAKPDYKVKYLLDNAEVYGGLVAGIRLFKALGAEEDVAKATEMAMRSSAALPVYWQENNQRFAWAKMENGTLESGMEKNYPDALANLCGLAWISGKNTTPWEQVKKRFQPATGNPLERWVMAAIGVADPAAEQWRQMLIKEAEGFSENTNGNRPAMAILTILAGRSWLPSIAESRLKG